MNKFILFLVVFLLPLFGKANVLKSASSVSTTKVKKAVSTEQILQDFYVSYATNVAQKSDSENGLLKKKWLTSKCAHQVDSLVAQTNADPIIRAQDFDTKDVKTLVVKHLRDDWYVASYVYGYSGKLVVIPVRVKYEGKQVKIDYISPE